jgi:hypothetical protein
MYGNGRKHPTQDHEIIIWDPSKYRQSHEQILQYTIKGGLIYVQPTIARYRCRAASTGTRPCN